VKRFYVYCFRDPQNNILRLVGKGGGIDGTAQRRKSNDRAWDHINDTSDYQYARMLKKRHRDGYVCIPRLIWVDTAAEAGELEKLLIAEIGREDLGTGPLWNRTDGGEGCTGLSREVIDKRNIAIGLAQKNRPLKAEHSAKLGVSRSTRSATRCGFGYEEWMGLPGYLKQQHLRRTRPMKIACRSIK
jgi:hypothetical protein